MIRRQEHFNLAGRNTFRMDVGCACWVEYDSLEDLAELDLATLPQPVIHIGAGSNLLFTKDFPGTLLHSAVKYYKTVASAEEEVLVEVGAGVVPVSARDRAYREAVGRVLCLIAREAEQVTRCVCGIGVRIK